MRFPAALGTLAALLLPLGASPAVAGDDIVRVPTRFVSYAGAGENLIAEIRDEGSVSLTPAAPPGTGAVPEGTTLFGAFEHGGARRIVAFGARSGGKAVVGVDLDGDGNVRGGEEVREVAGRPSRSRGRPTLRWRFPAYRRGTTEVEVTVQQVAQTSSAVVIAGGGDAVPVELADAPPPGTAPLVVQGRIRYGAVALPQGSVAAAFVRGEGERLTVLADVNRNGTLGEAGEIFPAAVEARDPDSTIWRSVPFDLGGGAVSFAYQEVPPQAAATWAVSSTGARRGTATVDGVEYALHLLDADSDGDPDWWWFGPRSRLARFTRLMPVSMVEAEEPFPLADAWRLVSLESDGTALVVKDLSAGHPDAYLRRRTEEVNRTRWFPRFREGREFERTWRIDATRPRAARPLHFLHDVRLDAALARAKAECKPLLVDFEADWCSNCKRWDYHVYADREVASLLEGFVLLKVNVDFALTDEVARLGGKNPPYLVFLDGDGQVLLDFPEVDRTLRPTGKRIPGLTYFQRPTDFAKTVRAVLAAHR